MEEEFKEEQIDEEGQGHLLSEQVKWMIVHYKNQGHSNKATAREVGRLYDRPTLSHQTIKAIWEKYLNTGDVQNEWSSEGRPYTLDQEDLEDLIEFFDNNPKKSVSEAKVTLSLEVSRQTINNALLDNGLKAYRAPKKFHISLQNVQKRLGFALQMERLTLNYWKRVLFSDESSFSLVCSNGRIQIKRTADEDYEEGIQQKSQSQTLMVWGIISYNGVGPLVRVDSIEEGESTLNGGRLLTILQRYLLRNYPTLKIEKLIFQQDNAPSHRYHKIDTWLAEKGIRKLEWPPQSPDMSLIEVIWNELKFRLRGMVFLNKNELWKKLKAEWMSIEVNFIRDLYEGMSRRISALKEVRGKHTKY